MHVLVSPDRFATSVFTLTVTDSRETDGVVTPDAVPSEMQLFARDKINIPVDTPGKNVLARAWCEPGIPIVVHPDGEDIFACDFTALVISIENPVYPPSCRPIFRPLTKTSAT